MTEQNSEEFEGFDDIWSAILDERVLIKLNEKIEAIKEKVLLENQPKEDQKSKSNDIISSHSSKKEEKEPDSPSNFKLIQSTIKSEHQKSLYKQFMSDSKAQNEGLRFELLEAGKPSEQDESLKDFVENVDSNSDKQQKSEPVEIEREDGAQEGQEDAKEEN